MVERSSLVVRFLVLASLVMSSCSLKPHDSQGVSLRLDIEGSPSSAVPRSVSSDLSQVSSGLVQALSGLPPGYTPPSSVSQFNCLGVNVVGSGIPAMGPGNHGSPEVIVPQMLAGGTCAYPGITSRPLSLAQSTVAVDLTVPAGPQRIVQILGIKENTPQICSYDGVIAHSPEGGPQNGERVFEVGRAVVDLFRDTTVGLSNSYDALSSTEKANRYVNCDGGASFDPNSISGLLLWLRGDSFSSLSDGQTISLGTSWPNLANSAPMATPTGSPGGGNIYLRKTAGPGGFPVVEFAQGGAGFYSGSAYANAISEATVLVVARRTSGSGISNFFQLGDLALKADNNGSSIIRANYYYSATNYYRDQTDTGAFRVHVARLYTSGSDKCIELYNGIDSSSSSGATPCVSGAPGVTANSAITISAGTSDVAQIAEILFYNRDLYSSNELSRVTQYLRDKYGL